MLEVIIDRSKWNRAIPEVEYRQQFGLAALLNDDGNMCCLGFVCKALGLSDEQIVNKAYPQSTSLEIPQLTEFRDVSYPKDTTLSCTAAAINDSPSIPSKKKEERLKELFLEQDIKLTFVGRTPKMEKIK